MMPAFCIAVPARNEADALPILIDALARQDVNAPIPIALCVNNSDDDTVGAALAAAARAGEKVRLKLQEMQFPDDLAHAGSARRAAMNLAADLMEDAQGLILSTDADCRPPADWVSANLRHSLNGHVVGGRIALDEDEVDVPPVIRNFRRRFDQYWEDVRAIEDSVDPCPWDPAPRHGDHTGASLCIETALYRRIGGVPLLPTGEDRALVEAAISAGATLIHPHDVWTRASARQIGRALGGMAGDMARWATADDDGPLVPCFEQWHMRAIWRRARRANSSVEELVTAERQLPSMSCTMRLPALRL